MGTVIVPYSKLTNGIFKNYAGKLSGGGGDNKKPILYTIYVNLQKDFELTKTQTFNILDISSPGGWRGLSADVTWGRNVKKRKEKKQKNIKKERKGR